MLFLKEIVFVETSKKTYFHVFYLLPYPQIVLWSPKFILEEFKASALDYWLCKKKEQINCYQKVGQN